MGMSKTEGNSSFSYTVKTLKTTNLLEEIIASLKEVGFGVLR